MSDHGYTSESGLVVKGQALVSGKGRVSRECKRIRVAEGLS